MAKLRASKSASPAPKRRTFWGTLVKWGIIAAIWFAIVVGVVLLWVARDIPEVAARAKFERKPSITILAADGSVVRRYGDYFQGHVNINDLPEHVYQAVMAIEDRRFYYHFGVDPLGLMRAMFTNVVEGEVVQGGSTITQQLAKNLFLTPERSVERKLQELVLSLWLEARFSKDEILSAYLNRVYYGSGAFGIEAAARVYYDRTAKDLTLYQSAVLAGLLKAPGRYAPHRNPERADKRARIVLQAMEDSGYIKEKQRKAAIADKDKAVVKSGGARQYYADWIIDQVDSYAGDTAEDIVVKTTYEPLVEDIAEAAFNKTMATAAERGVTQGAIVTMRADGAVIAIIGGNDYGKSPFNRATQARRQPGSSFKSFVYLSALQEGIGPERLVLDAPFSTGGYRPQNYDGKYRGPVTLSDALRLSLNTATLRLAEYVGIGRVVDTARRAGISAELEPNLSLALGSNEVTLLDLTAAYATFARMGEVNEPYAITEITTAKDKKILYNRERDEPFYRGSQRFNSGVIAQLRGMLYGVVCCGTGTGARLPSGPWGPAMGKTGTSQDYRDAWFIGFNDDLVTGVWMGNDDNKSMKKVTGGTFPAPLWRDVMTPSLQALYDGRLHFKPLSKRGYMNAAPQPDGQGGALPPQMNDGIGNLINRIFEGGAIDNNVPQGYAPEAVAPVQQPVMEEEAPHYGDHQPSKRKRGSFEFNN